MQAIAPNLTVLVGEIVGARLIAKAGNLMNLAKYPASTVQILGAEKALFRALKTKHETPKYGLIYHASLIGQTGAKNKGKVRTVETCVLMFVCSRLSFLRFLVCSRRRHRCRRVWTRWATRTHSRLARRTARR